MILNLKYYKINIDYLCYKISITSNVKLTFFNYKERLEPFNAPPSATGIETRLNNQLCTINFDNFGKHTNTGAIKSSSTQAVTRFTTRSLIQELLGQLKTYGITIEDFATKELKEDAFRLALSIKYAL